MTVQLRLALAQVDHVVGDLAGNARVVRDWAARAQEQQAHVVAFPEMLLTGYPPEDLVLRESVVTATEAAASRLAADLAADGLGELVVVVGSCGRGSGGRPVNEAVVLHRGAVAARYAKHHLPNYGVFDEARYFERGTSLPVLRVLGADVAVVICEDLWQDGGPVAVAAEVGVGLLVCLNGSPFERGKGEVRVELAARRAREARAHLAYVNTVGGQDELVFDGDSFVVGPDGALLARAPRWGEGLMVVDLDLPAASPADSPDSPGSTGSPSALRVERHVLVAEPVAAYPPLVAGVAVPRSDEEDVWEALVTGTRAYVTKNGFPSVVLGLSGGIDSAVVATLAADALGPDRVHAVAMPSAWSSKGSVEDAHDLATRQGIGFHLVSIVDLVEAWRATLPLDGLALENLQARIRGTLLMALSNRDGHLVLTTGNKSELATGFSTLYGDSAGGYAPLKDVPKTLVWQLARWRNARAEAQGLVAPIPVASIDKPPSAELAPGQLDSDRLPDYAVLDAVLEAYVEDDLGRAALLAAGHDAAVVDRVLRLVDLAEHKRRQYPPGPKITPRAFGRDRRLPITSRWREPQG